MERAGLVERRAHPEDGRAHLVRLTERGAQLAAQVVPEHEALVAGCMALLTPADLHALTSLLRTLDSALGPG
jgi:DNA-binding MarR family transcriptional regulator